jgi:hypothetical protein
MMVSPDDNPRLTAGEFVIGAFVDVLEPSPSADVVDEDVVKVGSAAADIVEQLDQPFATLNSKAATAFVRISADDREIALRGVDGDGGSLVLRRVALMVRYIQTYWAARDSRSDRGRTINALPWDAPQDRVALS